MSKSTSIIKNVIPIIAVTWILSLVTTLAVVYVEPSFFSTQSQPTNQNQIEIIRFYEPDEMNVTGYQYWDTVASFVWTPKNPANNVILEVYCYFEYRCENPEEHVWEWEGAFWWEMKFAMRINDFKCNEYGQIRKSANNQAEWGEQYSTEWKQTCFGTESGKELGTWLDTRGLWINPNQNNYTLKLDVYHSDRASSSTPTFVRNINVILEVIDGIPPATI